MLGRVCHGSLAHGCRRGVSASKLLSSQYYVIEACHVQVLVRDVIPVFRTTVAVKRSPVSSLYLCASMSASDRRFADFNCAKQRRNAWRNPRTWA